jgi:threonylcarbamoyladenosine tRNA methylthiotransferase MtaB
MVGVRGETQDRWNEYVNFVDGLDVSQLHVFTYSERANTRMVEMNDLFIVPQPEREKRSKLLHGISDKKLLSFYHRCQGQERTVLWESRNDKGNMYGFTDNYIKLSRPYDPQKVNTFEKVIV